MFFAYPNSTLFRCASGFHSAISEKGLFNTSTALATRFPQVNVIDLSFHRCFFPSYLSLKVPGRAVLFEGWGSVDFERRKGSSGEMMYD